MTISIFGQDIPDNFQFVFLCRSTATTEKKTQNTGAIESNERNITKAIIAFEKNDGFCGNIFINQ